MVVTELNDVIELANILTGDSTITTFSLSSNAKIFTGDESAFRALLTNEENGQVLITDQNLIVDSGEISIETANDLDATTEGTVTADIAIDTTVANLATLEGTNAYTIKIADSDATGSTAEQLLAIDNATTVTVDASAITSIEGTFEEITALYLSLIHI